MKHWLLIALCVFFTLSPGFLFSGCIQTHETPLRVGANVWPGYEGLYLARSLGYYQGPSIQLIDFPSAREVIRALRDGAIDAGAITADEMLLLAESGKNLRIVLILDFSNGADVILARAPIKSVVELKGRRVGVEPNAVGTFLLARALEMSGLTVDDIQVVPLTLEEHERGFLHRQVDAVVTFEPRRSRLLAAGAVQIFNSSQIPGEIVDVMAVRQELIDRRSKAVESLVKGWFRAVDYMKAQPEAAARVMAARENITPEEFQRSLTGLEIPDLEANLRLLGEGEDNLARRLRHLSAVMMSRKLLRSEVDTQTLIENRFVKRMKP